MIIAISGIGSGGNNADWPALSFPGQRRGPRIYRREHEVNNDPCTHSCTPVIHALARSHGVVNGLDDRARETFRQQQ